MRTFSRKAGLVVALLLALVLVFSACNRESGEEGGATTNGGSPQPPEGEAHGTVTNDSAVPMGNLHPITDFGGRVIRTISNFESTMLYSAWDWEEPDPATSDNYFNARLIWDNAQRVYEQFNITQEAIFMEYGLHMEALLSSVMAGDPLADIAVLDSGSSMTAIRGNLIHSLDSINLPNSDLLGPQIYTRKIAYFLNEYWTFYHSSPYAMPWGLGVNMDIINSIGAPSPADLYNQGRWTWDEWLNIMRMATADTTGDGMFDRWGLAGQPADIGMHLLPANDGRMLNDDLTFGWDSPNSVETLEFLATIFREGLWQYDAVAGFDTDDWNRNFHAFQSGQAATWLAVTWGGLDNLPFDWIFVPIPLGPSNTSGNTWSRPWDQGRGFVVGTDWTPEDLLMISEEFLSWSGDEVELMHDGNLGWPRGVYQTEGCIERLVAMNFTGFGDVGRLIPEYSWMAGGVAMHARNQSMTVMEYIESERPVQQERIDLFFGW